jgi:hypothetical protein
MSDSRKSWEEEQSQKWYEESLNKFTQIPSSKVYSNLKTINSLYLEIYDKVELSARDWKIMYAIRSKLDEILPK